MEDKIYDLLEKMHIEFSSRFDGMENRLSILEKGQQKIGNDVTEFEIILKDNSKTLFDGYKQTYEKLETLEKKIDDISAKVDKQEVEIKVIKGGKA
jgi:predicted RNase H-like nuclease (RuvC/YqgF family)